MCGNCKIYFSNRVEICDYDPPLYLAGSKKAPIGSSVQDSAHSTPLTRKIHSTSNPLQRRILYPHAHLPQTVGLSTLDPFNTQLKSRLPSSNQLLHHCMHPSSFLTHFTHKFEFIFTNWIVRPLHDHREMSPAGLHARDQPTSSRLVALSSDRRSLIPCHAPGQRVRPRMAERRAEQFPFGEI